MNTIRQPAKSHDQQSWLHNYNTNTVRNYTVSKNTHTKILSWMCAEWCKMCNYIVQSQLAKSIIIIM